VYQLTASLISHSKEGAKNTQDQREKQEEQQKN
jgi:hypothetical protein